MTVTDPASPTGWTYPPAQPPPWAGRQQQPPPLVYYGKKPPPPPPPARYVSTVPGRPPVIPTGRGLPGYLLALLIIAGVVVIGGALGVVANAVRSGDDAAREDVSIVGCANSDNQFLGPTATVQITNHGTRTATYAVTVDIVSGSSHRIASRVVSVRGLDPGMTETRDAPAFTTIRYADLTCKVTDVTKF